MGDFHFIDNPAALAAIDAVLGIAGPNFNAPYDASTQPSGGGCVKNSEDLLQYQVPGGSTMSPYANPAITQNMGLPISSLMGIVMPFISSYGLILPILGLIRGLIEIMCCLMNPFCVIAAVIRLFTKWIPPFIALFPPFAGIIIILSTIKLILAIVFFVLTQLIPTILLIINNIRGLASAFGPNGNPSQQEGAKQKLAAVLKDLLNRLGVLSCLLPLLEVIFLILGLVSGFPCGGGNKSSKSLGSLNRGSDFNFPDKNDTALDCPSVLRKGQQPKGRALILPSFFGESLPFFAFNIITLTGNSRIREIKPYLQSIKQQLDEQLDEPVDEANPFGGDGNSAHFTLKITDRRGNFSEHPITKVRGNSIITLVNPSLITKIGIVDYEICPNYPMLVGRNIIGIGCHPDVEAAIQQLSVRTGDLEQSALEKNPEIPPIQGLYQGAVTFVDEKMDQISEIVLGSPDFTGIVEREPDVTDGVLNYDVDIANIEQIQEELTNFLIDFTDDMKERMNGILSRNTDRITSDLDVDKNIVKAGGGDNKATVFVTPRDFTGAPLAKNLPDGVFVNVEIFTDFGILANQQTNNETGEVTAELTSPFPGLAKVSAKVNTEFITTFDGSDEVIKEVPVQFVADSVLPKRRLVSTPDSNSTASTVSGGEGEPGRE